MNDLQRRVLAAILSVPCCAFGGIALAEDQPIAAAENATDAGGPPGPAGAETAGSVAEPECDKGISMSPDGLVASLNAANGC